MKLKDFDQIHCRCGNLNPIGRKKAENLFQQLNSLLSSHQSTSRRTCGTRILPSSASQNLINRWNRGNQLNNYSCPTSQRYSFAFERKTSSLKSWDSYKYQVIQDILTLLEQLPNTLVIQTQQIETFGGAR